MFDEVEKDSSALYKLNSADTLIAGIELGEEITDKCK